MPAPIPFRQSRPSARQMYADSVKALRIESGVLLAARCKLHAANLQGIAEIIDSARAEDEPPSAWCIAEVERVIRELQAALARYGAAGSVGGNDG